MSALIVGGIDIEPFLPRRFSDDRKEAAHKVALHFHDAIENLLLVGVVYNGVARVVEPHALYR